jgi:putative selenium metabolism hydrolase
MLTPDRSQQVIQLCQELIQRQSYSGQEGSVVERMKQAFHQWRFDETVVDSYGNILGRIKGKRPGKVLLLDGHIDTVPVPDPSRWTHNPYGGEIAEGRIYGRGSSDMKGAVAAMVAAAAFFAEDTSRDFAGSVYVSGVVQEEHFEGIAARQISERIHPDYVVIGESSEMNLKRGQRGRAEIVVETFGKPAHSANPRAGINAVYAMAHLIREIAKLKAPVHPILGEGILELTDIKSSPYPGASVVPDYCRATYDRRLLVGETRESVLKPLQLQGTRPEVRRQGLFRLRCRALLYRRRDPRRKVLPRLGLRPGRCVRADRSRRVAQRRSRSRDYSIFLLHQWQPLRRRGRHQDHRLRSIQRRPCAHHRRIH